ncbi:Hypothetical predicted protein [Cloeon dipterum]|uniref:Lipoprotein n=1 Tax=Cloeon dipterum TaxID=197152 RepID=A0A8S1CFJ3_9INSE|nr:Hypothetical predicted protein [Cloeon dipterum]
MHSKTLIVLIASATLLMLGTSCWAAPQQPLQGEDITLSQSDGDVLAEYSDLRGTVQEERALLDGRPNCKKYFMDIKRQKRVCIQFA